MAKIGKRLFAQLYSEIGTKLSSIERELLNYDQKKLDAAQGSKFPPNKSQSSKDKRLRQMRKARKAKIKILLERVSDTYK